MERQCRVRDASSDAVLLPGKQADRRQDHRIAGHCYSAFRHRAGPSHNDIRAITPVDLALALPRNMSTIS